MAQRHPYLVLTVAVFCLSTAALTIKASAMQPLTLSAFRLLLAAAFLSPIALRDWRRHRKLLGPWIWRRAFLPGLMLACHFIAWVPAVRLTYIANASLIVNLVPVVMPLALWIAAREKPTRVEWIATSLATIGLGILMAGSYHLDRSVMAGDFLCFVAMLFLTAYFALGRKNRALPSLWVYVVPVYAIGGAVCFVASLFFAGPFQSYPSHEWMLLATLVIVPTVIGHSLLNWSFKHLGGQTVSLHNQMQFVYATALAWLIWRERPSMTLCMAIPFIAAGVLMTLFEKRKVS